jgi:ABC-2 type transport system ATP-binding protein
MTGTPEVAIQVRNLAKRFGEVEAVAGVDFEVGQGEIFGFLGPNGAGKTTTINMLTGLARPDAGAIRIAGIDCTKRPRAAQHLLGVVPDESNLYPELTGFQNLCFCAALYGLRRQDREARAKGLLAEFGLAEAASRKFAGYSKGMKRKLALAAGIIHQPRILFLDEPTTGLDVASARQVRRLIAALHQAGTTIFLTTHYIEEAERLCGRIAFIVAGRIVRTDTVADLIQPEHESHVMFLTFAEAEPAVSEKLISAFPDLVFQPISDQQIRVEALRPVRVGPLARFLEDQGVEVLEARRRQPSLEDIFVRVTGIEAEAMRKDEERMGGGA